MTPETINIAIAEFCGLRPFNSCGVAVYFDAKENYNLLEIPNYHGDLNATRESILKLDDVQYEKFMSEKRGIAWRRFPHISNVTQYYNRQRILHNGCASDECEALLRTINKWEDEK